LPKLNSRQREAVRYAAGPLLVLAGAGSGKTSAITHKIAWLIRDGGLDAKHVTAVTFTNKAAREMKERVAKLVTAEAARALTVSTFHTLGLNILRREHAAAGYRPGFSIYDADDSLALIRDILRDGAAAEAAQWRISRWKNALLDPESAVRAAAGDAQAGRVAAVYAEYQRSLKAYNSVDFDDLILQPVRLFERHPERLAAWRDRIRYLLVDEYQDTNLAQYALVRLLVGERGGLTVVGDDDQSIYAWRGAQPENLNQLQADFPDLKIIKLEQNYRSTGRILKAANALISRNPHVFEKRLWSELGYGDPLRVVVARDEEHEAEQVVANLLHHKFLHRTKFSDYAVLYRGNHQARLFERVLREQRIPYYLSGGLSFFERAEIRDLMAYFRLICNPDDNGAFLRVVNTPRREIGAATLEGLTAYAGERAVSLVAASFEVGLAQRLNDRQLAALRRFTHWITGLADRAAEAEPAGFIKEVLDDLRYDAWLEENSDTPEAAERRMENVLELAHWLTRVAAQEDGRSFPEAVARIALLGMLDNADDGAGRDEVSLMTLHAAKGLEFPHVFMVGMEEGFLPHRSSLGDGDAAEGAAEAALAEERRLAYVGITRAQRTLTFTLARRRKRYGEVVECAPSRFLSELPADDLQWEGDGRAVPPAERQERADAHLANLRGLLGR
jgi:ATP-dependent DNA helicase Rep